MYRTTTDLINIGEAASELTETNRKPKTSSSSLMPNTIILIQKETLLKRNEITITL